MRKTDYKEWKDTLTKYKAEMTKELAAVRKAKQELYEMQRQLQEMAFSGRYERDDDTLILSAPNIIIGNVDKHGNLLTGNSNIVIRGNNVALEGVGEVSGTSVTGGQVVTRARTVKVQTVDPGPDGRESVAFVDSSFSVQSAAVGISAETLDNVTTDGVFTRTAKITPGVIEMSAERSINVAAAVPLPAEAGGTDPLDAAITSLNNMKSSNGYVKEIDDTIEQIGKDIDNLDKNQNDKMLELLGAAGEQADTLALRSGLYKFEERTDITQAGTMAIAKGVVECCAKMANLAEANRIHTYLTAHKDVLAQNKTQAETQLNGASVNISSEIINLKTADAHGKVLTAPGNGVNITTQNTTFSAMNGLEQIKDSTFKVVANTVDVDACEYTYAEKDGKPVPEKSEAKGTIKFNAGKIELKTLDREYDTSKDPVTIKSEKPHAGSHIWLNTEKTDLDMSDSEGNASGTLKVNAKEVDITAFDFKKDGGQADKVTAESKIKICAETMILGTVVKEKLECKHIQVCGNTAHLYGKESMFAHQDKVGLSFKNNDKATIIGSDIKLGGNITLSGDTEVKGKFTAGDIEAANVKASSSVTGPNLKDGIPVPGSPATAESSDAEDPKEDDNNEVKSSSEEGGENAAS